MSKIVIIGDVHGKTDQYQKMLRQKFEGKRTVQIGDMGIGFKGVGLHEMSKDHGWFRGNHDNPAECYKNKNYMGDCGFSAKDNVFWVAGAYSIDWAWREPGRSWWPDEELSPANLKEITTLYATVKPRFVLSHDCPSEASTYLLNVIAQGFRTEKLVQSRTGEALQYMFDQHKPEKWIFGHYHIDKTFDWKGTEFTCVNELSTYELDTDPR